MSQQKELKKITVPWVKSQKGKQKLTMLTSYDYPMASVVDRAGIEMILVGDSVGTVMYGQPNTLSVTMDDMVRHTWAVAQAASSALVIADMPFMSYQVSVEQAVENAGRLIKEGQAQAVKLEGGVEVAPTIEAICRAGIPVVAHIGLTPQSINSMGRYRMHGKSEAEQSYLKDSAEAVANAGAFCVVLECVEKNLSREITKLITVPTIGIGAGVDCDGQVLVVHDLLGLTGGHVPKFVKKEAELGELMEQAVRRYITRTKEVGQPGLTTGDLLKETKGKTPSVAGN